MAIESSILFRIGSKPIGGGFTELKSAIDLLGAMYGKVQEVTKELDRFAQMWQKTNQAAVLAADSAAGGLVDTGEVLRGYQKLMKAGVKVTDEQFSTITARAAEMAQATGVDATEAFKRLTSDISKGTTRSLKEYGVSIATSTDLTKTQQAAIEGLTEGYEGLTVSAQTTTERLYVLENNIGTLKGLVWEMVGANDAFEGSLNTLNGALGEFNTLLAESPSAAEKYILSLKGIKAALLEMQFQFIKSATGVMVAAAPPLLQGGLNKARDWMLDKISNTVSDLTEADREGLFKATAPGTRPGDFEWQGPEQAPQRRRSGRGKGKKKEPEFGMEFTEEESEAAFGEDLEGITGESLGSIRNLTNEQLAERIGLEETITELWAEQEDQQEQARQRALELAREEEEQKQQAHEAELERAQEFRDAWSDAYSSVDWSANKTTKTVGLMSDAIFKSVDAAVTQEKHAGAAIVGVLADVGSAMSEEAGWQVLMETAKAIAAAASQNYVAAAAHGAAAVAFGIAAARSGGGGGAKAPSESTAARYSERFAGSGPESSGGGDSDGGTVNINIQMKEGAGGFFDAMVEENDRASIDGRRNFESN